MADETQHAGKKRRFDELEGEGGAGKAALVSSSGGEEDEYRGKIKKMLTHLPKEALVDVLSDLGSKYQQVYDEVYRVANTTEATRKLFVHGLPYEVASDTVRRAFEECGEVENAHVVTDKATGKNKGFGFVTYKTVDAALLALAKNEFLVDGRTVRCHLACEREGKKEPLPPAMGGSAMPMGPSRGHHAPVGPSMGGGYGGSSGGYGGSSGGYGGGPSGGYGGTSADVSQRKLFVRSLPFAVTDDLLRQNFMPYGDVEEAVIVKEKGTNKSRGFGFVTMRYLEGAQAALARPPRQILDRDINVTLAAAGKDGGGTSMGAPSAPGGYGGAAMMSPYGMMGMPMMGMGGMPSYGAPDAHSSYSSMMGYGMGGHMPR